MNLNSVYANNEICLEGIEVYGFDYDYTLATYRQDLHHVLYDLGRDALVTKYKVRTKQSLNATDRPLDRITILCLKIYFFRVGPFFRVGQVRETNKILI